MSQGSVMTPMARRRGILHAIGKARPFGIVAPRINPLTCRMTNISAPCTFSTRSSTDPEPSTSSRRSGNLHNLLRISDEVASAVKLNKPIVALESTIYTHGVLGPTADIVRQHAEVVRGRGGVPAVVAIVDGVPVVGASVDQVARIAAAEGTRKVSRRDMAYLAGMGLIGKKMHGGTTISGTMLLARLAGIRIFGTGGLGGVHRGGHDSLDISADLTELGRTRVAVVCSGCKGFLDIPRTLEFLETQGCLVATFTDGRSPGPNPIEFPAFWARDSGTPSPAVITSAREAAAMVLAQERLAIESGMLFANPIPAHAAIPAEEMAAAIEQALREANEAGATGSRNTPFVLRRLAELTGERTVAANRALVEANIARATDVAVELSGLFNAAPPGSLPHMGSTTILNAYDVTARAQTPTSPNSINDDNDNGRVQILVAGAGAIDLACDYAGAPGRTAPQPHTSNPARISQTVGGVGYNVTLAAHRASRRVSVRLCSAVGDDVAGATVLAALQDTGLDATHVRQLDRHSHPGSRTAQYVAVNDGRGDLVTAMADMSILSEHASPEHWEADVAASAPKWLVIDGNWTSRHIRSWIRTGRHHKAQIVFEPVSAEKSEKLFYATGPGVAKLGVFPHASVDMASPNAHELAAMWAAAKENGYLELGDWFGVIDALGMTGARDRFVRQTSAALTDAGVPLQSVQLLPYIPTLVTKLGPRGVLVAKLLGRDDALLRDRDAEEFILARAPRDHPSLVGGIYMRLYPAVEEVSEVASVSGAGDTFLGVMLAGLAQGGKVEELVDVAQRGAVLSLKCAETVPRNLGQLEESLARAVPRGDQVRP